MPTKRNRSVKRNPSRRKPAARDPRIRITYEIMTPKSAKKGDVADSGWIDEDGVSMKPDKYDTQDGITAVDNAIKFLEKEGVSEYSSSGFDPRGWYISEHNEDYSTGEEETHSYHLVGFSDEEKRAIYRAVGR